ncbi:hypothetical protein [Streptomyces sp. NRRL F-5650]|uniref:hypothetical protein n=1 Tax=Streptomyces sp. NRRL F-5650 TaxID=1463868 RepID=UPI00068953C6|nr:hypothetical protein [Streptomyces sp. NRRL F-5650]
MIAVAAALAEIVLILVHRVRAATEPGSHTPWRGMAVGLLGCLIGWLVVGRPETAWSDLSLTLVFGVVVASEAAHAARTLSGRSWTWWGAALLSGAAAATWLLPDPLPFG